MLAPVLAVAILVAYAGALWWLLRRESMVVALALVALCGLSVSLRLVYTTNYPPGLNEDEPNNLESAVEALQTGQLFRPSRVEFPVLLSSLFEAQLIPVFGANRWTIRTYSLVTSVLSVPAAFAVARALGLGAVPSIAASAFFAVLPWSLFFGRVSEGGELTFHQLLLLAALGRLVLTTVGGWVEVGIGGLGLCLLLYDYWCGRSMLAMPLVAAVLARGRQRPLSLAVLLVAVLGWLPYLLGNTAREWSYYSNHLQVGVAEHSVQGLWVKTIDTLRLLISNCGADDWMTISSAGMHPPLVLVLALVGALIPVRRSLFLWAGFVCGLAPAVLSGGAPPHAHRMLMAFSFIALAAGCLLDQIKRRVLCVIVAAVVVTVISVQSVRLYFSPEFWSWDSREEFAPDLTSLVEALPPPPHPRFILQGDRYFFELRGLVDKDYEFLSVQNMYPPDARPVVYAFQGERRASLRAFYDNLFGSERVTAFGAAYMVKLEAGDWSWLRQHGWAYQAGCNSQVWRGQIPTLYLTDPGFGGLSCSHHVWQGRWRGPHSQLRLDFSGTVVVETSQGRVVEKKGQEQQADFPAEPDMVITVTLTSPPPVYAKLLEVTPAGERVPPWERVDPDFDFLPAGTAVSGEQQTLPPAIVPAPTPIPLRGGPEVSLTDLSPLAVTFGFAPPQIDHAWDGSPMVMGGVSYAHGIGTHAWCRMTYAVPPNATSFQAIVGLSDDVRSCHATAAVTFEVRDDRDALRFGTGIVDANTPPVTIDVDVRGAATITLVVTEGGNGRDCDHANWAQPVFRLAAQ